MPTSDEPAARQEVRRQAVRAFLLTPEGLVLLMRIHTPDGLVAWIAPGGGIEPGEAIEDALCRELGEEVGLTGCAIGPPVWRRDATFNWGALRISQTEDYRVVHTERFEPVMTDAVEAEMLEAFRWWPLDELLHTKERLFPPSIGDILSRYLRNGAPPEPLEIEVVVD